MRVNFLVVLMSVALIGLGLKVNGQGVMRGMDQSVDLKATERSIQMELIVEEIEDAGFMLDIEEGFEEEWEEEIWISSEEEFGSLDMDLDDTFMSGAEDISVDDFEDDWDQVIWEEEIEDDLSSYETTWVSDEFTSPATEDEDDSIDDIIFDDIEDGFQDDNLEEASDPGWDEINEEIEFDELEFEMEDEDIDLMEEIHNAI